MYFAEIKKVAKTFLTFRRVNNTMCTNYCWNVTGYAGLTNSVTVSYVVWLMLIQYAMLFDGVGCFFEQGAACE